VNKDLIIDVESQEVSIALLEDKVLTELHKEKRDNNYSVGDLYLGKVKKVIPGLNAAFVDVGYEKDAFLHYLDLGPQVKSLNKYVKLAQKGKPISLEKFKGEPDIDKNGKINKVLSQGDNVLVQIAKEPINSKGPRITSELSFAGRYIVLMPFSKKISVSQKIKDHEERNRLRRLVKSIQPNNFGIIVRTVAENKKVADLIQDLEDLKKKWVESISNLNTKVVPYKVHGEMDRSATIVRDLLNEEFSEIRINDKELHDEIRDYMKKIAPNRLDILKLYKGNKPIFNHYGIENQIKSSFGQKVSMQSGTYLIIEHTEAMHVIDVNSGQRLKKEAEQEGTAFKVNKIAAKEIARQLRLRDMGGIIVIDFIDMTNREHRRELFQVMKEEMQQDHAKHTILPPSKFGLIQITRQRVRPEMEIEINEKCPVCDGSGEVRSPSLIIDEIENNLAYLIQEQNESSLTLRLHPFIHSHLTKGWFNYRWKWFRAYGKRVKIEALSSYHYLEYHFFNQYDDEIKI
jgi:ribonuclease G